jgi:hypothetical protein
MTIGEDQLGPDVVYSVGLEPGGVRATGALPGTPAVAAARMGRHAIHKRKHRGRDAWEIRTEPGQIPPDQPDDPDQLNQPAHHLGRGMT